MFEPRTRVTRIAYGAVFAALVAATTTALNVTIPSTKGYFNLGDLMVYTCAILTGPLVGGIAGGVGSALSDTYLTYYSFAPGTLVIKGVEGFVVGYLYGKRGSRTVVARWKALTLAMCLVLFLLLAVMGSYFFTGTVFLGGDLLGAMSGARSFGLFFDLWLAASALAAILLAYRGLRSGPRVGWSVLCVIIGGTEMVVGYFLYEVGILGIPVPAALVEVPVNIAQLVFGLAGSLFLTEGVAAVFRRPAEADPSRRPA